MLYYILHVNFKIKLLIYTASNICIIILIEIKEYKMPNKIWDKLAKKYDKLWVQKYSLTPTRNKTCQIIKNLIIKDDFNLLDLGCGTGQLLEILTKKYPNATFLGIDKSYEMINFAQIKNINANFTVSTSEDINFEDNSFDFIVCCHSFPYYENKQLVVNKIKKYLKDDGYAIFIQASINTLWDKLVLWGVEKTAEKAEYLSRKDFKNYFQTDFDMIEEFIIKEKFYMPTIAGFVCRKK